jgi:predicted ArsR family transcriptional regulator
MSSLLDEFRTVSCAITQQLVGNNDEMILLAAIADPVRLAMVRQLSETADASLAELAAGAGVHTNTARAHLVALEDAGVVTRSLQPTGSRGRPGVRYRLAEGVTFSPGGFLGLAELLAAALLRCDLGAEELRTVGRRWGRYLLGRPGRHDLRRDLPAALDRIGFQAQVNGDVALLACPCPIVSPDQPEVVCELVAGVVEGVAGAAEPGTRLGPRHHDPTRRACRITLSREHDP